MELPTDDQLEERTERLLQMPRSGYLATFEALKVDRESLRLLEEARSFVRADGMNDRGLSHKIDAHIALLKSRLGIDDKSTNTEDNG